MTHLISPSRDRLHLFRVPLTATSYVALSVTLCLACTRQDIQERDSSQESAPLSPTRNAPSSQSVSRAQDQSPTLAQIGETRITESDLQRRLDELSPITRARYQNPTRRKELLTSMVRFELLANEAKRRGHHMRPEVILTYKQAMVRELLGNEVRELVKMSDITEAEVSEYYHSHLNEYERPELTRAAHVLFKDQAEAHAALKQLLLHVKARPQDARVLLGDLAAEKSQDQETKARRGDLQYFTSDGAGHGERRFPQSPVPKAVATEAFKLKQVGEISAIPIQSPRGWHIVQRTGGKRAFKRALSEVRTEIRNLLFRARKGKALEEYVAQIKAKTQVTIFEDRLSQIKLSPAGAERSKSPSSSRLSPLSPLLTPSSPSSP